MIVKGKQKKSGFPFRIFIMLILLCVVGFLKFYSIKDEVTFNGEYYHWDFENIENERFVNGGYELSSAIGQSTEKVLSGKYSCKIDKENRYSPTFVLESPTAGKSYEISIWTINPHPTNASLYVCAPEFDDFNIKTDKIERRNSDFWSLRKLRFKVPNKNTPDKLIIYLHKDDSPNEMFIDDFSIVEINTHNIGIADQTKFKPFELNLIIDKEASDYLEEMRNRSIVQGTIYNDGSKAKGKIIDNGVGKRAEFRLKGDWLDHISGNPSLRVDLGSEVSWNGMQSFSIQEPHTRGFLREWVFFKFLDFADVLHPRYDFFWYNKNGEKPLVFSYEEHFTKNLVEHGERREGPIIKLTEDRIWDITRRIFRLKNGSYPTTDKRDESYWLSEIRTFKEGKLIKNPTLMKNFELAHSLMNQFKYNSKPVKEIFDIDRLAKYMALVDITMAHHAITWHNQRFYYNPVTSLLEPIGFDAYTEEDPWKKAKYIMAKNFYTKRDVPYEPLEQIFYDSTYVESYFYYLNEYSQPSFIVNVLNDIEEDILERETFIRLRYPNYSYNREEILEKAKNIRVALPAFENSLIAFKSHDSGVESLIKLYNAHPFPLYVYSDKNKNDKIVIYPQNENRAVEYIDYRIPSSSKKVYFEMVGIDSLFELKVLPWPSPSKNTPRQRLKTSNLNDFPDLLTLRKGEVIFKKGKHFINEPLIIADKSLLKIFSDTEITFGENGYLLSYSPVYIVGDADSPIKIISDSGESGSVTVLQAEGKSVLKHVEFRNQNTMVIDNWNLTGAVSFYESDVDISHVAFRNNNCEDALNIVRSDFNLSHCLFYGTYGDAFDADFCKGTITKCQYLKSGNDAIDVSGSNIRINDSVIDEVGDKGVSAGENSRVVVNDSKIIKANIGAASKDLSNLTLNNVQISFCKTGVTAFQKKPEFGPAKIFFNNSTITDSERQKMIEKSSLFIM